MSSYQFRIYPLHQMIILPLSGCVRNRYVSVHRSNHFLLPGRDIEGYVGWSAASLHAKGTLHTIVFYTSHLFYIIANLFLYFSGTR